MKNSKKLAIQFLNSLQNIKVDSNLTINVQDLEFIKKIKSNSTNSRYYIFISKDRYKYLFQTMNGSIKERQDYVAVKVRISDHKGYDILHDTMIEDKHISINDIIVDDNKTDILELI